MSFRFVAVRENPPTRPTLVASSVDSKSHLPTDYSNEISMQNSASILFHLYIFHSPTYRSHSLISFKKSQNHSRKGIMATSLHHPRLPILQFLLLVLWSFSSWPLHASEPYLTLDYYAKTCPTVFEIIRKEMECAVLSDPRNAAFIVRLHFHDCFVQVHIFILHVYKFVCNITERVNFFVCC